MFRIAEVAQQTGFSRPTLRYYEDIGLVEPRRRSDDGHRLYDEATVEGLRFVARAKRLGLSLDEIRQLVDAREGGSCAETRHQLHHLVGGKMAEVRKQIEDATVFLTQLEVAHASLAGPPPQGEGCGCAPELPEVPGHDAGRTDPSVTAPRAPAAEEHGCACCAETSDDHPLPPTRKVLTT